MDFPKTFTDKSGREWPVHIGLAAMARLREAGIPLEEFVPMPSAKMAKAPPDLSELADLLHGSFSGVRAVAAILAPKIAEAKISDAEFLESVDDERVIESLSQALYQAILDFFHRSPLRQSLVKQAMKNGKALMAAAARSMDKATSRIDMTAKIQELEAEQDKEIEKMMPQPGKNCVGSTPG
jgi:hypothetical protein